MEEIVMRPVRKKLTLGLFAFLGLVGLSLAVAPEVLAVVGRPLTPVSYAGVARRSVRRATYP
jgi:hypothetical protein